MYLLQVALISVMYVAEFYPFHFLVVPTQSYTTSAATTFKKATVQVAAATGVIHKDGAIPKRNVCNKLLYVSNSRHFHFLS